MYLCKYLLAYICVDILCLHETTHGTIITKCRLITTSHIDNKPSLVSVFNALIIFSFCILFSNEFVSVIECIYHSKRPSLNVTLLRRKLFSIALVAHGVVLFYFVLLCFVLFFSFSLKRFLQNSNLEY